MLLERFADVWNVRLVLFGLVPALSFFSFSLAVLIYFLTMNSIFRFKL